MNNYRFAFFHVLLFFLLFLYSCNSVQDSTLPEKVAPDNCRINGTVVKIFEVNESSGPCSINPCTASVKIDNVVGTGFSFKTPLIKDETIKIKFEFTLSETSNELFPTLNNSFPGLKVGDKFTGDVERIELIQFDKNSAKFTYRILNYDKID